MQDGGREVLRAIILEREREEGRGAVERGERTREEESRLGNRELASSAAWLDGEVA